MISPLLLFRFTNYEIKNLFLKYFIYFCITILQIFLRKRIIYMRDLHTLLFMLLLPSVSYAQDRIAYNYDAAGNRVKREIVMLNSKAMAKQQIFSQEEQSLSEIVNDKNIKISTNTTSGILTVSIPNLKSTDRCSLEIYNGEADRVAQRDRVAPRIHGA